MNIEAINKFKQNVDAYNAAKPEDDIDLVEEVRNILIKAGLGNRLEAFDNNHFIQEAKGKYSVVQRYLLNRFWGQQLMLTNLPTAEERYCLIPNGEVSDWLKLFENKVLPFILENDLPIAI